MRCSLVAHAPCAFSHAGAECGWPDLATMCPNCGHDGKACSFFLDNTEGNGCRGLSQLVTLCLRCQLDGLQWCVDSQLHQCMIILSGGKGLQCTVSFATGHFRAHKDSLERVAGVLLPQDIATPETEFFWDRSSIPWRFSLVPHPSTETVTMRRLHSALGMDGEAKSGVDALDVLDTVTLAVQLQELMAVVHVLVAMHGKSGASVATAASSTSATVASSVLGEAAQAAKALHLVQGGGHQLPVTVGWNPSETFNLSANTNATATVVTNQSPNVELACVLMQGGASTKQIMQFLQARTQVRGPVEHCTAWLQAMEGTSPLCMYTACKATCARMPH